MTSNDFLISNIILQTVSALPRGYTSSDDRSLYDKFEAALKEALTEGKLIGRRYKGKFLSLPPNAPINYIKDPSQYDQIVSEGMGYFPKILVNAASNEKGRTAKAADYQRKFDAIIQGALEMKNKKGLISWRVYYDEDTKKIEIRGESDEYSAADADVYLAWALIGAIALQEKEGKSRIFVNTGMDYRKILNELLRNIKGQDVIKVAKRLVLTVSEAWGEEDIKGAVTFNPSYAILAALYDIARYDEKDKTFWLQLRKDAFNALEACYSFSLEKISDLRTKATISDVVDKSKYIRIGYREAMLLKNLIRNAKLTLKEIIDLKEKHGFEFGKYGEIKLDEINIRENRDDGSWDFKEETYEYFMALVEKYWSAGFFPDFIELAINKEDGKITARPEVDYPGLNFIEHYDAIRVYAEIAKDLLHNNDAKDNFVPADLRISKREQDLLLKIIKERKAKNLLLDGKHGIIPISVYFLAAEGLKKSGISDPALDTFYKEFARYIRAYGYFKYLGRKYPKYYEAILGIMNTSEYFVNHSKLIGVIAGINLPPVEREIKMVEKLPKALSIKENLLSVGDILENISEDYEIGQRGFKKFMKGFRNFTDELPCSDIVFDNNYNLDYLFHGVVSDILQFGKIIKELTKVIVTGNYHGVIPSVTEAVKSGEPLYRIAAKRRYYLLKEQYKVHPDDPELGFLYGVSLLGIGKYKHAYKHFFNLIQKMPELKGHRIERIYALSIKFMLGAMSILNIGKGRRIDALEWIPNKVNPNSKKALILRAAYINQLNEAGRYSKGLEQSLLFLKAYDALYKDMDSFDKVFERITFAPISGGNLRLPMLRKYLLSKIMCEAAWSISNMYYTKETKIKVEGKIETYPKRIYHYKEAFALLNKIFGSDNPHLEMFEDMGLHEQNVPTNNTLIEEIMNYVEKFKEDVSKNMRPTLTYTAGKMLRDMSEHKLTDISIELYVSEYRPIFDWYFEFTQKELEGLYELNVKYKQAQDFADNALTLFKISRAEEIRGIRDPQLLTRTITSEPETSLLKQKIAFERLYYLNKLKSQADAKRKPTQVLLNRKSWAKKEFDKAEKTIDEINESVRHFGDIIIEKFEHPILSPTLAFANPKLGDSIDDAASIIVSSELAQDPRAAIYYNWLRKNIDYHTGLGFNNRQLDPLLKAWKYCQKIPHIYVSNPTQRAEFLINGIKSQAMILYFAKQILDKMKNKPQLMNLQEKEKLEKFLTEKLNETMIIISVLLEGKKVDLNKFSSETQTYLKAIQNNEEYIKEVFQLMRTLEADLWATYGNVIWWRGGLKKERERAAEEELKTMYILALEKYKKALGIQPNNVYALLGSAWVCAQDEIGEYERSLRRYGAKALQALVQKYDKNSALDLANLAQFYSRIYDRFDKFYQEKITEAQAYLRGEITAESLKAIMDVFRDI